MVTLSWYGHIKWAELELAGYRQGYHIIVKSKNVIVLGRSVRKKRYQG